MKRIFISHSFEYDTELVNNLREALISAGFRISRVDESIEYGSDIASYIISAIHSSDIVIAIVGRDSPNVLFELGYAMGARKDVLLLAESDEEIPSELQSLPCVRLSRHEESTIIETVRRINKLEDVPYDTIPSYQSAEEKLRTYYDDPDYFESIDGKTFEKLLIELFREKGFDVKEITPAERDFGYDFSIESSEGKVIIVEAKKFSRQSKVSVSHIRSLLGAALFSGATSAMLVSSTGFTASAINLAASAMPKLALVTVDEVLGAKDEQELLKVTSVPD